MTQPDILTIPFGENAAPETINPIPTVRQPSDDPQQATWSEGFPRVTMQPLVTGGIPPKGQDFNGILKSLSEHIVFQNSGGQYRWSNDWVSQKGGYSLGDVVQSDDGLRSYVSAVDNNTDNFNTNPSAIGTSWLPWSGGAASELVAGLIQIATTAEAQALTNDTKALTPKKLLDSGAVFAGEVRVFAGAEANIPEGWLPCNGAAISRTTYSRLFGAIGTTYGSGNGSSTFNLPDLRGSFVRGFDSGRGVDSGRVLGSSQLDALQNITGRFWDLATPPVTLTPESMGSADGVFDTQAVPGNRIHKVVSGGAIDAGISDGISFDASRVARTATETRPRNVAMNYIIKY